MGRNALIHLYLAQTELNWLNQAVMTLDVAFYCNLVQGFHSRLLKTAFLLTMKKYPEGRRIYRGALSRMCFCCSSFHNSDHLTLRPADLHVTHLSAHSRNHPPGEWTSLTPEWPNGNQISPLSRSMMTAQQRGKLIIKITLQISLVSPWWTEFCFFTKGHLGS